MNKIKSASSFGLYGSIVVAAIAIAFHFSPYAFYQSSQVHKWMLITGAVLGVLSVAAVLLTFRKSIPQLRQSEAPLDNRIKNYSDLIRRIYLSTLAVNVVLSIFVVLSGDATLLMLVLVMVMMLVLSFPNMYKVKADLGLTDEDMTQLYGDQYIK